MFSVSKIMFHYCSKMTDYINKYCTLILSLNFTLIFNVFCIITRTHAINKQMSPLLFFIANARI